MSGLVSAAKLAAKYGPHVVTAWQVGGEQAVEVVKAHQARVLNRRNAIDKARTVTGGSVLRQRHGEAIVWVVYAGDDPVEVYPPVPVPIGQLVEHADLSARRTPEELDQATAPRRVRRAVTHAATRAKPGRRPTSGELT